MSIQYGDLPAHLRKQVDAQLEGKSATQNATARRPTTVCHGTCSCGEKFDRYTRWEKHSDTTGHRRWSVTLSQE